jgi:hypothetical protein
MRPAHRLLPLLLAAPLAAAAAPWLPPTPVPGLRLEGTSPLRLVRQRISVDAEPPDHRWTGRPLLTFEYVLEKPGAAEVEAQLAFEPPEVAPSCSGPAQPILEPHLQAGDLPVEPRTTSRAMRAGHDVTDQLTALGLAIEKFPECGEQEAYWRGYGPAARQRAEALGLVKGGWPRWALRTSHRWTLHFPPGRPVTLRLRYDAPAAPGLIPIETLEAGGCLEDAVRTRLAKVARAERRVVDGTAIALALQPTLTGVERVPALRLEVSRPRGWLTAFCWEAPVERVGEAWAASSVAEWRPGPDLTIYYLPSPR